MDDVRAAAVVIFGLTYAGIAFNRLPRLSVDRPWSAFTGAVLMVLAGVLTLDEAWQAVNAPTIVLLLGMMVLNVFLEEAGFFELAAEFVLRRARTPARILIGLSLLSGVLSALFLNDTVCLMLTPPLLIILRRTALPATPFLLTLAMSANVGSVMTITGNPQNMLVGNYSGWMYGEFLLWMLPVGIAGLVVMTAVIVWFYGPQMRAVGWISMETATADFPASRNRPLLVKTLLVLGAVLIGFVATSDLPLAAACGAAVLLLWSGESPTRIFARVNWVLLLFFAGLFIVVHGLERTGLVADLAAWARPMYGDNLATQTPVFCVLTVVASNVVSNVPFVVLVRDVVPTMLEPRLMWLMLAMASTFAGNLTIPGSVATLIVLEAAKDSATIRYWEFLRVGLVVTLLTVAVGAALLLLEERLFL